MKIRFCYLLVLMVFFNACHADPGIIEDDDNIPTGIADTLKCDSLPAPNNIFSNVIGESLIFTDATQNEFDTLLCLNNEADNIPANNEWVKYCERQYIISFSTNWLLKPDAYQIEFSVYNRLQVTVFKAKSITLDDFEASTFYHYDMPKQMPDSIIINGKVFEFPLEYNCLSNRPCTFVESFIFSNGQLVAYKRKDKWWTRI